MLIGALAQLGARNTDSVEVTGEKPEDEIKDEDLETILEAEVVEVPTEEDVDE